MRGTVEAGGGISPGRAAGPTQELWWGQVIATQAFSP